MARRFAWLDLRNARDRQRDEERLQKAVFPLGPVQREKELQLLAKRIPSMKTADALYQVVVIKGILTGEDPQREQEDWEETRLAQLLTPQQKEALFTFAKEALSWASLDDIPEE